MKRLRQALGDTPLFLWRYEDYPAVVPAVLQHCMGAASASVTLRDSAANPGFSAPALEYLATRGKVTPEASAEALHRFPKGPEHPAFAPWTDAENSAMTARYAADLQQVEARGLARVLRP